jgi:formylglycine-generating enzyme
MPATDDGTSNRCYGVVRFTGTRMEPLAWLTVVGPVITNVAGVWQPALAARSNHPIVNVTWYGAALFCNFLSEADNLLPLYRTNDWSCNWVMANETNAGYHLPTEAQWECAARGGRSADAYPWGRFMDFSRCNVYASGDSYETNNTALWPATTPVRAYAPNGFGLYDMIGNAREWCQDWYDATYYARSPAIGPTGPDTPASWLEGGSNKVTRGGAWAYSPHYVSAAARNYQYPATGAGDLGFRVSRYANTIPEPCAAALLSLMLLATRARRAHLL